MRFPIVTRAFHDAMIRVEQQRCQYLIDQVREAQDLVLVERDRNDQLLNKVLAAAAGVPPQPEPESPYQLKNLLPDGIRNCILQRAVLGSHTYLQLQDYALEQMRLNVAEDLIGQQILAGAGEDIVGGALRERSATTEAGYAEIGISKSNEAREADNDA